MPEYGTDTPRVHHEQDANSQRAAILADLKRGWRITPLDALEAYGCFRLSARIYDLRKAGHAIEREMVDVGDGKRVAEYRMGAQ